MARVLDRNISALIEKRGEQDRRRNLQDRLADRISAFAGSMANVYLHGGIVLLWVLINVGALPFIPRFDPTFVILAMVASVEAISLSAFVLITQNRMAELADRRADLDLQISLLAEHEVTRLVTLVRAIAQRLGMNEAAHPELSELAEDAPGEGAGQARGKPARVGRWRRERTPGRLPVCV